MSNSMLSVIKRAEIQKALDQNTKGKAGKTLIHSANDLVVGAIGGGLMAAALGRKPAFIMGLVASLAGYYWAVPWLPGFGLGMTASSLGSWASGQLNTRKANEPFSFASAWEGAKERMAAFKDGLLETTNLDKIIKPSPTKTTVATTSATEEAETVSGFGELDMSELDRFEQQVTASAMEYQQANNPQMSGLGRTAVDFDPDMM